MEKLFRILCLGLVLAASTAVLSGCGGEEPADDPAARGEPVMDNVPPPNP